MELKGSDIDFTKIDWRQFEEVCFDLLVRSQFHSLIWRQGGSDMGRDIEAKLTVGNSLVGAYDELWFVECKHHGGGIAIPQIQEKIEWARVKSPAHFLLFTSSYVTQNTREWLSDLATKVSFQIHVIEGKRLVELLLNFPDIVAKYFFDSYHGLLRDLLKQWVYFDTWPEPAILHRLHGQVEARKLGRDELAFFYAALCKMEEEIEAFCEEEELEYTDPDYLVEQLAKAVNVPYPLRLGPEFEDYEHPLREKFAGNTFVTQPGTDKNYIFLNKRDARQHLQVAAMKSNRSLDVRIALGKPRKK